MHALKIAQLGNSLGVILPKEALARFNLAKGDALYLTDAPGGYRLSTVNPEFEAQMTAARKVMKKRRHVLAELAK